MDERLNRKTILLAFALQEEVVDVRIPGYDTAIVVTGVGKARAAMTLMKAVLSTRPQQVINIGTAGTFRLGVGDIVVSRHFVDRDFLPLRLPGIQYEATSAAGKLYEMLPSVVGGKEMSQVRFTVSTGDDFVTTFEQTHGDVVDMEAYVEALVCESEDVPFFAVKYVTDIVGQNSVGHWQDRLADARRGLTSYFNARLK